MFRLWSNLMFNYCRAADAFAALGWPSLRDHVPIVVEIEA